MQLTCICLNRIAPKWHTGPPKPAIAIAVRPLILCLSPPLPRYTAPYPKKGHCNYHAETEKILPDSQFLSFQAPRDDVNFLR